MDTSERAAEIQVEVLRHKTDAERLQIALDLSNLARRLAFARIRMRHPDFTEREVVREFSGVGTVNE